jgi:hypothetical protein
MEGQWFLNFTDIYLHRNDCWVQEWLGIGNESYLLCQFVVW